MGEEFSILKKIDRKIRKSLLGREGGLHKPCGGMDIFWNYKIKVDYDYSCIIYLSSYQEMDSGQNQIRLSSISFDFVRLAR